MLYKKVIKNCNNGENIEFYGESKDYFFPLKKKNYIGHNKPKQGHRPLFCKTRILNLSKNLLYRDKLISRLLNVVRRICYESEKRGLSIELLVKQIWLGPENSV